ncbi:hypothetical protein AB0K00_22745 [Dactylosporangium sp. NPDC049525]|uniref:hypothetical protein n=1 Tax=Dactylosporangium sp. NPDC049525 TaxID=3154730 RepID=UPI00342944FB
MVAARSGLDRQSRTAKASGRLGSMPEDAYQLHAKTEQWQMLATQQQELAARLRQVASDQREMVALWDAAQSDELTAEARIIEDGLRSLVSKIVNLELAALERVRGAIEAEARAVRSKLRP